MIKLIEYGKEVIHNTFLVEDVEHILRILLARVAHNDELVWSREPSGEFIVKSAYKLLHTGLSTPNPYELQPISRFFYRNLWQLEILTKIKIEIWRMSKNYIPTMSNFLRRHLVADAMCPRYGDGTETLEHVFCSCPVTVEVWNLLGFHWVNSIQVQECFD